MTPEEIINAIQSGQYALKAHTINLPAGAIDQAYINVPGNFIRCWNSNNSFFVGFDDQPADIPMDQGIAIPNRQYLRIKVRNPNPSLDLTVSLLVGYGYFEDNRFFIRSGGLPVQSPHIWDQANVTVENTTGTDTLKLVDFDANRVELVVENLSSSVTVRLGPNAAAALTGSPILPGGSRIITCCAEFYAAVLTGETANLVVSSSYYDYNTIFGT